MNKSELNRKIIQLESMRLLEICSLESMANVKTNVKMPSSYDEQLADLRSQYSNIQGENNE